ncbi:MAG: peptide ABC transporter substrate-binding protein [Tissierellia bacterium]|nr:peptide ABC transporter substrate-binding protein [Tissierellia bacterium]
MKNKKVKLLSLMLALVLVLTACGGNAPANNGAANNGGNEAAETTSDSGDKKILRTNNSSEPGSLDPALATGTHESWILEHTFQGLMQYNDAGEIVEGAAESYEISEDGLTYTFTLKDGLTWSNGDPVVAGDFEYAWKRVCDPDLAADYSYQIADYVVGGQEALDGEGSLDDIGVKALDDKTLEVQLKSATPYFLGLTAFYTLYPVPSEIVKENPDWAKDPNTTELVSNGAFKVTKWDHNDKIVLEKNENYLYADEVKLDGIELDIIEDQNTAYSKYQAGEYDLLVSPPTAVIAEGLAQENEELIIGDDIGTYYFEFNTEKQPFNNAKVRQAFSMALNRKVIVENVTQGGQPVATGMVPYGLLDDTGADFAESQGELIKEDLEGAKALLEEGLAEENMTIDDLQKVVLSYNTDENHRKIAEAVQEMWKQGLGVEIGLENMEFQVLLDNRSEGNFNIARAGWMGDYADPNTMLDIFMSKNPHNDSRYANEEFDALMAKAKSSSDPKERMDAMKEAEKILMEDLPIIPVYFYNQARLEKPYLTGVYKNILSYPTMIYADLEK